MLHSLAIVMSPQVAGLEHNFKRNPFCESVILHVSLYCRSHVPSFLGCGRHPIIFSYWRASIWVLLVVICNTVDILYCFLWLDRIIFVSLIKKGHSEMPGISAFDSLATLFFIFVSLCFIYVVSDLFMPLDLCSAASLVHASGKKKNGIKLIIT